MMRCLFSVATIACEILMRIKMPVRSILRRFLHAYFTRRIPGFRKNMNTRMNLIQCSPLKTSNPKLDITNLGVWNEINDTYQLYNAVDLLDDFKLESTGIVWSKVLDNYGTWNESKDLEHKSEQVSQEPSSFQQELHENHFPLTFA